VDVDVDVGVDVAVDVDVGTGLVRVVLVGEYCAPVQLQHRRFTRVLHLTVRCLFDVFVEQLLVQSYTVLLSELPSKP